MTPLVTRRHFLALPSLLALVAALFVAPQPAPAAPSPAVAGTGATPPGRTAADKPTIGHTAPKGAPASAGTSKALATTAATCAPACYFYNAASQFLTTKGIYANLYPAAPVVPAGDYHSLAELAAIKTIGGKRQIVEVGWTVDRTGVNGADYTNPHLFVFRWVDGVGACYNGCGFVDYAPTTLNAGDVLPLTMTNAQFGIQYDDASSAWWIAVGGQWIGYFPDSIWTSAGVTGFTNADNVQAFGEVAASTDTPCSDMGNAALGHTGAAGVPQPSRIGSIAFYQGGGVAVNPNFFARNNGVNVPQTNSNYSMSIASTRTFYYGGPGFC